MKHLVLFIALVGISFTSPTKIAYSITKETIDGFRVHPVTDSHLLKVIQNSDQFIQLDKNPYLADATLEHHLVKTFSSDGATTYIVFEYFFLEGRSCNIKAVTLDSKNELLSIIRLANYVEFPDAELNEFSFVENDFAVRTKIVNGLQEYNDSLQQFIMKRDSTIMKFKLNQFKRVELVDSVFKHYEYIY